MFVRGDAERVVRERGGWFGELLRGIHRKVGDVSYCAVRTSGWRAASG